jgi:hypothetical protein
MPAYLRPLDLRQKAFLECIRWADAVSPYIVLVVDIDFHNFNMAIMGEEDGITAMSSQVQNLFLSAEDKLDRKDAYGSV